MDNKDKEDILRTLLRDIIQKTPIYFHDYALEHFPKVIQEFFLKEQQQTRPETFRVEYADSSNKQYKIALKKKVDEDYKRFLGLIIIFKVITFSTIFNVRNIFKLN